MIMNRKFRLSLTSIRVSEPLGDGLFGGADDMYLCGIAINRNGQRYNLAPINIINTSAENTTFEVNPPKVIFDLSIPYLDDDFIFCFWLYEKDNNSVKDKWNNFIASFNFWMDRKLEENQIYRYPAKELHMQTFTENLVLLHAYLGKFADDLGDSDDVFMPFIIRASHLGGTMPLISNEYLKSEYNGTAEGSMAENVFGFRNYGLYFSYHYSKVASVIAK